MIYQWTRLNQSPWHGLEANAYFMVCGVRLNTGKGIPEGRETSREYPTDGRVCEKCHKIYEETK